MSIAPTAPKGDLAPGDPRHGERAGYIAGCRDECCRVPHLRYQKLSTMRRMREGSQYLDPAPINQRLEWWAQYGVTPTAVSRAAGLCDNTLAAIRRLEMRAEKTTMRAALAVTWADLDGSTLVNAEATRWRLYSLMAAGHPLRWLATQVNRVNEGGKWRQQEKVTLGLARDVMALFDSAPIVGPSKQSATKAKKLGYVVRGQWDNPTIPAMPHDWRPTIQGHRLIDEVDEVVVLRVLAGEVMPTTRAERVEIIARWGDTGRSLADLERMTGWKIERYRRAA